MNFVSKIKENPLLSLLIILLILLGIVFVVVLCVENPKRIFNLLGVSEKEQPKYEVLKFLGISMGGILIALQALMSYKRATAMEKTADGLRQERLKNAKESDLSNVFFGGGFSQKDADSLKKFLENRGANIGAYPKEDAEAWIAEYEKSMSEVLEDDS